MVLVAHNPKPPIQAPLVKTAASPPTALLLQIRAIVSNDEALKEKFVKFRDENKSISWLRDITALPLSTLVEDKWTFGQVLDACQYLADEYQQLPEGIFLVSTETGKVEGIVSEDDILPPQMLPRESGGMAKALAKIRPDKEAAFVLFKYSTARDASAVEQLTRRAKDSPLVRQETAPGIRMATRAGRTAIAENLSQANARELFSRVSGSAGAFLRHFPLRQESPEGYVVVTGTASYRSRLGIQDVSTLNLAFDREASLRETLAQGWVRAICVELAKKAHDEIGTFPQEVEDLDSRVILGSQLWVSNPESFHELRSRAPRVQILPVDGIDPIGLAGDVGWLEVGERIAVETYERFARWEIVASVSYTLHINPKWEGVQTLHLLGLNAPTEVVF